MAEPPRSAPVPELELDRHVLASSVDAWDTAWRTYGWTPALAGSRAGRLEEQVPWGTRSSRMEHPPRLGGSLADVLDAENLFRLNRSWLPMDGRRGFSIWGATERGPDGSEWRVVTHTFLLDEGAFRALAGHPAGLLAPGGGPAPWLQTLVEEQAFREPVEVEPVRVRVTDDLRAALARDRLEELHGLAERLVASRGGDRPGAARELGAVYEALAQAVGDGEVARVVVRLAEDTEDGRGRESGARALLLLAWLSLPLEDRLRVSFATEQRRAEHPPGHLLGLPDDEWGRYVPAGAWVAGESPTPEVSPGRMHWAERLLADDGLASFRALEGRARVRGWLLIHRDDLRPVAEHARWQQAWEEDGPSLPAVESLMEREWARAGGDAVQRPGRPRAVGDALARALEAGEPLDGAVELARRAPARVHRPLLAGAVRRLRRTSGSGLAAAARLRLRVTEREGGDTLVPDLRRLVDREADALRALLALRDGPEVLVRGVFAGAARGDRIARELLRIGGETGTWDPAGAAGLVSRLPVEVDGGAEAAAELLLAAARGGADPDHVEALAVPLLERVGPAGAAPLAPALEALAAETGSSAVEVRRIEALRMPALDQVAGGGRELDGPATTLILLGRRTVPPAERPEPWLHLVERAPAAWLGRGSVLAALARVLEAGSRPFGHPDVPAPVRRIGSVLLGRVLDRSGPSQLDAVQADSLLRLLWLEGSGGSLERLALRRPEAVVPLLAQLLLGPAPMPLALQIRSLLQRALDHGASSRGAEDLSGHLAKLAPALALRLAPDRARARVLLPVRG